MMTTPTTTITVPTTITSTTNTTRRPTLQKHTTTTRSTTPQQTTTTRDIITQQQMGMLMHFFNRVNIFLSQTKKPTTKNLAIKQSLNYPKANPPPLPPLLKKLIMRCSFPI